MQNKSTLGRVMINKQTLLTMLNSDAGTGGPIIDDQLTLFQPGRADYSHLILLAPPKAMFFIFRHHWSMDGVLWFSLHVQKPQINICPIDEILNIKLKCSCAKLFFQISNLLVTLNSSVNLFIYCGFGRKFRREFKKLLGVSSRFEVSPKSSATNDFFITSHSVLTPDTTMKKVI